MSNIILRIQNCIGRNGDNDNVMVAKSFLKEVIDYVEYNGGAAMECGHPAMAHSHEDDEQGTIFCLWCREVEQLVNLVESNADAVEKMYPVMEAAAMVSNWDWEKMSLIGLPSDHLNLLRRRLKESHNDD